MDTNRNTDVLPVPSGFEVESATFRLPVDASHTLPPPQGMHGRIDELKSRGLQALDTWKSRSNETVESLKSRSSETVELLKSRSSETVESLKSRGQMLVQTAKQQLVQTQGTMREGVHVQVDRMNGSMRTSPAKWAGIAAASGFVIGMIGRWSHHRSHHRSSMPQLVIIEAC
ncbi:MAG TPA: hypothetical protein VFN10_06860 [Thermoanaerobaculia bacterium]|nr:hypothetical protein [Thermoanaerobaculia bacterium]